ncbi:MAG: hypothetical protein Kow0022_16070 [Phycisphaerales bacterium]
MFKTLLAHVLCLTVGALLVTGCSSPLSRQPEQELREAVRQTVRRELADSESHAETRVTTRGDAAEALGLSERVMEQLRTEYDPKGYLKQLTAQEGTGEEGDVGAIGFLLSDDLFGRQPQVLGISLERAIKAGVRHNLDVELARFGPAQREADVVAAQAAFDWAFVASLNWEDSDNPRGSLPFAGFGGGAVVIDSRQSVTGSAGLERTLITGGRFSIQQQYIYTDTRPNAVSAITQPNPSTAASLVAELNQPLLQGFGSDVNLAEVRTRENAERRAISALRQTLIATVTQIEDAYWDLVKANADVVILSKLLERGIKVRDDIKVRSILDADPAQIADAVANVERRRADVLRAQRAVRAASDRLKLLMGDPRLPVGSELILVPTDEALDQPLEFSLYDSLATAIAHRPEIEQAILNIDDASIRQVVAENGRLPQLDLRAQLALVGFEDSADEATSDEFRREFIDNFLLGLLFRQPLGNRADEAAYRRARLDRMQSVVAYRKAVQTAVSEVRSALDDVVTNYRLIDQARTSRLAAAEALRTLLVKKELSQGGYTVERLNLELSQQAALAAAERAEVAALLDYNRAISRLHAAMGTSLERNRINFIVPDANQLIRSEAVIDAADKP